MSIEHLDNIDIKKLIELLINSDRTTTFRREGLCREIGINIGDIPQAILLADNDFGKKLIDILFRRKLEESLCKLCEILEEDFSEGAYNDDLRNIQEKLKYDPDRNTLLNKVKETRVDPFLNENGLINQKLIPLNLEELPTQDLLSDTKVINIFNKMGDKRTLLILGQPGSGKTTILAELAKELIEDALKNKNHLIPIILNLSSWKESQTIQEWSVKRLKDFYQVPEEKGWALINQQKLLLLIDGFDELKLKSQKSCVDALNDFINRGNSTKIVVCSRTDNKDKESEEKEKLLQKLTSQIAVRLRPLEGTQAIQYLNDNNIPEWLINFINNNNKLQNLIKVPLFLYLIIEVSKYNNSQTTDISPSDSEEEIWNKIFNKYIEKQLKQWKSTQNSSEELNKEKEKEKVERYLNWLANQMYKENTTEFLIEKMQPKWLCQSSNQVTIQEKIYRIGVGLIVGLLCGLASGLFSEILNYNPEFQISWINYIFFGLISGLLLSGLSGLILLLPENLESNLISKLRSALRRSALRTSALRRSALRTSALKLLSKLIFWLRANINFKLASGFRFVMIGLTSGLIRWIVNILLEEGKTQPLDAIIFGIVSGFIFYRLDSHKIETVDKMKFSIREFTKNSIGAGVISLLVGTIMLFIGTLCKLNYDSDRILITFPMQKSLETVFNTPWFNNFLKKAVEQLIISYKQDNNTSVLYGLLAFILFIVINLLVWITIERIEDKPEVITQMPFGTRLAIIVELIVILYLIFKSIFSQSQDIISLSLSFFNSLNVLWGLLTLELFVGLQVGISLGFRKADKIEVTEPNHGIIKTRKNALQAFVISGICSFVVSVVFWLIYYKNQNLIWWIYYKPEKQYNAIFFGLIVGLKLGLLSGLINGGNSGLVCIKHFVLRIVLWLDKKLPWNYAHFLQDAAKQGLLIQTGGSFRFKHLMLLEHFIKH